MGNKNHEKKNNTGQFDQIKALTKDYSACYQLYKAQPIFLKNLFNQCPKFGNNIAQIFPKSNENIQFFIQMILFFRRQQSKFTRNQFAIINGPNFNLLDRYFMVTLNLNAYHYRNNCYSLEQIDQIFIQYFRIFVQNPQKGTFDKIIKYAKLEGQKFKLPDITTTLRQYFPNCIKYLKEFYNLKFKKLQKDARLLKKFTSKIVKNDGILLALKLPRLVQPQIVQLYNTQNYGLSFHSIQKQLYGYTGPWIILVHHYQKNEKGDKQYYVFGSYQNGPIRNANVYQGDLTGFMFTINPHINFYTTDKGDNGNRYFFINSIADDKTKKRKGIGFGGNEDKKQWKLWLDQDLDKSRVYNGRDPTYGYGYLASPNTQLLNIKRLQIWGLGSKFNIQDQQQYRKQRQEQIMKRRKVDKKEFAAQNAQMFFENTFAHRDQVVGQIQHRKQQKQQK